MPLYDFRCRRCDRTFEELVRTGGEAVCPGCGTPAERLTGTPAVSTGTTRAAAHRAARRRDAGQARDRMHERLRYEKSHDRHG